MTIKFSKVVLEGGTYLCGMPNDLYNNNKNPAFDIYKRQYAESAQNYEITAVAQMISTNVNKSWHFPLGLALRNECS